MYNVNSLSYWLADIKYYQICYFLSLENENIFTFPSLLIYLQKEKWTCQQLSLFCRAFCIMSDCLMQKRLWSIIYRMFSHKFLQNGLTMFTGWQKLTLLSDVLALFWCNQSTLEDGLFICSVGYLLGWMSSLCSVLPLWYVTWPLACQPMTLVLQLAF